MHRVRLASCALVFASLLAITGCDEETDPEDAGGGTDSGTTDAGTMDAGDDTDAGPADSGPADSGPADSGPADSGPADSGPADAGPLGCIDTAIAKFVMCTGTPIGDVPADFVNGATGLCNGFAPTTAEEHQCITDMPCAEFLGGPPLRCFPRDAGTPADSGPADAGATDAGATDAGATDAGT